MRKPGKTAGVVLSGVLALASAGCTATTHQGKFMGYNEEGTPVFEKPEYYSSGMNLNIAKKIVGGALAVGGLIDGNVDAFFYGASMVSQPDREKRHETNVYVNAQPQQREQLFRTRAEQMAAMSGVDVYDNGASAINSSYLPISFTCRDAADKNGDGLLSRDEVEGLGSFFDCRTSDERIEIYFGSAWSGVGGKTIACKVSESATGKIITANQEDNPDWIRENDRVSFYGMEFYKAAEDEGIHQYAVEWFVDGKLMPERTVNFFVNYGESETDSFDAE